jgi:hypothetical protein
LQCPGIRPQDGAIQGIEQNQVDGFVLLKTVFLLVQRVVNLLRVFTDKASAFGPSQKVSRHDLRQPRQNHRTPDQVR